MISVGAIGLPHSLDYGFILLGALVILGIDSPNRTIGKNKLDGSCGNTDKQPSLECILGADDGAYCI